VQARTTGVQLAEKMQLLCRPAAHAPAHPRACWAPPEIGC